MRETGIIAKAEKIRAFLGGATQMRVPIPLKEDRHYDDNIGSWGENSLRPGFWDYVGVLGVGDPVRCPFGSPGDTVWFRETWRASHVKGRERPMVCVSYKASPDIFNFIQFHDDILPPSRQLTRQWKSSTQMPRWASRIVRKVKRVWVEQTEGVWEWCVEFEA